MYLNTSTLTPDDAIASVLGKTTGRPRDIIAALDQRFLVSQDPVTGKTEVTFAPAGTSPSSGSGVRPLRGSHASLFERANAVIKVILPAVARIEAAGAEGDCSEVEAIRSLIPPTLAAIANALGSSEPPVNAVVEALLDSLDKQTYQFGSALGIGRPVITPCDEKRATDFTILTQSQQTLTAIWKEWRSAKREGDLGAALEEVAAEMNAIADATDELRAALLAAGIVPAEWSSLNVSADVNLAQFFDCVDATPERARIAVRDGGRYGLTLSVEPMLCALKPIVPKTMESKDHCGKSSEQVDTAFCRIGTAIDGAINAIHAITKTKEGQS
ncbi:MAG TPA: hypothetical protein VGQ46_12060 [Thermoanaerobaculia bacterium]|jgi:hypothetical protein|nr:hypothetical protein [Thermoanaerobaculia bacterium]